MKDPKDMTLDDIADALDGRDLVVSLNATKRQYDGVTHINTWILERISNRIREISMESNGGKQ